jgi:hypothetical protein
MMMKKKKKREKERGKNRTNQKSFLGLRVF